MVAVGQRVKLVQVVTESQPKNDGALDPDSVQGLVGGHYRPARNKLILSYNTCLARDPG